MQLWRIIYLFITYPIIVVMAYYGQKSFERKNLKLCYILLAIFGFLGLFTSFVVGTAFWRLPFEEALIKILLVIYLWASSAPIGLIIYYIKKKMSRS